MRFGFVGSSYTARSSAVANEECINFYVETLEATAPIAPAKDYGGSEARTLKSLFGTPGLSVFATLPEGPVRGSCYINGRAFAVGGSNLVEVFSNGTQITRATVANDGNPVSIVASNVQLFIVSGGKAYCYTLATNAIQEVTSQLAGTPMQADYSDGYFIVCFQNSNQVQISNLLDGTTWNSLYKDAVSVFPDNIVSILMLHREVWIFGNRHTQPYYDSGSTNIFDVISGALVEKGCAATFAPCKLDNTVFWVDEDEHGGRACWRANGYTPQRISTHAVEDDLQSYTSIAGLVSYAYQDGGHLFWVLYVPGASWHWCYDVQEGAWHKRAAYVKGAYQAHWSQNHMYAFGKHLVGDWNSANLYQMSLQNLTDNGMLIRRLRRAPTVSDEMQRIYHAELTIDFETGIGPQVQLTDGNGNPRPPQAMLHWSDDRGRTWSNEHWQNCGFIGQYHMRAIWRRDGNSRYRVYEMVVTDPISWTVVDAYLRTA